MTKLETFFESAAGLRGLKQDLYEGGVRVPTVVRWPGRVPAGSVSGYAGAFWDWLPTFADLLGVDLPAETDGVSLLPVLQAREEHQAAREYLYWEFGRGQAVRMGDWKAVRRRVDRPIELYDLASDPAESRDMAADHPEVVTRIAWIMEHGRTPSERFPLPGIDRAG